MVASSDKINELVARALAKQISESDIWCPACLTFGQKQPLSIQDGESQILFCPHCMLGFQVVVNGWPHHYRNHRMEEWLRLLKEQIK